MVVIPAQLNDFDLKQVQELAYKMNELLINYVQEQQGKVRPETVIIAYKIAQQPLLDQIVRDRTKRKEEMALPSYGAMGQA